MAKLMYSIVKVTKNKGIFILTFKKGSILKQCFHFSAEVRVMLLM
jgi:hypothetical protein